MLKANVHMENYCPRKFHGYRVDEYEDTVVSVCEPVFSLEPGFKPLETQILK